MGASTVYDVRVKYTMDDKASSGIKGIASATDRATHSSFMLTESLGEIAHLTKEAFGIGKELLIDFNSEMDKLKIGMTTVMQMNMHMPFEKASAAADKLFETFQAMAKKSPLMTKDFMEMASALAPAISMAGGGVGKLEKMTQGALQAGLAFNVRPDQMAMDIQEMLAGNVRLSSRSARQLLASQGIDKDEFNQKSAKDRAGITEKILTDPALLQASERASHTMAGEVSTLKDNIQIAFGAVGLPLMQQITAEFKKINVWVDKHPKLIKEWVTSFSATLKQGFEWLKNIVSFFVEHKDLIFSLAKTFVMFKGAQMATNVFRRFTEGVGGLADSLKSGISSIGGMFGGGGGGIGGAGGGIMGAVGGFGKMIPVIGTVIQGLFMFKGALDIASEFLNGKSEADKKAKEAGVSLNEATEDYPTIKAREALLKTLVKTSRDDDTHDRFAKELKGVQEQLYSPEKLGGLIRKIDDEAQKNGAKYSIKDSTELELIDKQLTNLVLPNLYSKDKTDLAANNLVRENVKQILTTFQNISKEDRELALKYAFPEQYGMPTPKETPAPAENWGNLNNATVNLNIQRIEVASEDPDRFVFGLVNMADQAVRHSTQSQHTLPGGF